MGPGGQPSDNPGLAADSMSKVRMAVDMLQQALPGLPIGSPPQKDVLDAIQKLSKSVPASEAIPGVQQTQLAGLQKEAQESAMLQNLSRAMGSQQGPGPGPVQLGQ